MKPNHLNQSKTVPKPFRCDPSAPPTTLTTMAYNRMSIVPAAQQQSRNTKKKEEDTDAFMRLPDKEIVGCITDIGIPFSVPDLQKPNPQQVQMIFEWFADLLLNATRETIEPAMRAAADDVCGPEHADLVVPPDARNLMAFYASLRRLLAECGIVDFSLADLYRPTHDRLVRIFSYLINFVRFRESQTGVIDAHFNRAETTKARIEGLYADNQDLEARIADMAAGRARAEAQVADKTRRNDELKKRLLELRRNQERVAARLDEAKARKTELAQRLEEGTAQRLQLRAESAKLRPYTLQSPTALQASLAELGSALAADRARLDSLDRRARALQTSADSFAVVSGDVAGCIRVLDEIAVELGREDDEGAKLVRQKELLSANGNNVREVERHEALLQRQLAKWVERTERLREQSAQKAAEAREKMEELRAVHKRLTEERAEKGREMERRRVRIEQTEKKVRTPFPHTPFKYLAFECACACVTVG